MKRVYPLTKKSQAGGKTLYDQEFHGEKSPFRSKKRKGGRGKHFASQGDEGIKDEQTVGYGTDAGNTSGEDGQTVADKTAVIDGELNV